MTVTARDIELPILSFPSSSPQIKRFQDALKCYKCPEFSVHNFALFPQAGVKGSLGRLVGIFEVSVFKKKRY